jgi:hypothetical protein
MARTIPLTLSRARLFPPDPEVRRLAVELCGTVRELPITPPHSHVPAQWLADDIAFSDPPTLLITPDHYEAHLAAAERVTQRAPRRPGRPLSGAPTAPTPCDDDADHHGIGTRRKMILYRRAAPRGQGSHGPRVRAVCRGY